jgi:hypothetical protein
LWIFHCQFRSLRLGSGVESDLLYRVRCREIGKSNSECALYNVVKPLLIWCSKDGFLRNFDDEKDDKGADYHTAVSTIENP